MFIHVTGRALLMLVVSGGLLFTGPTTVGRGKTLYCERGKNVQIYRAVKVTSNNTLYDIVSGMIMQ